MKKLIFILLILPFITCSQDEFTEKGVFTPNFFSEYLDVEIYNSDTIFVTGVGGFIFIDISDINNPQMIGRFDPGSIYKRFYNGYAAGNIAVGAARLDGLYFLNISSLAEPSLYTIHNFQNRSYESVELNENVAYAAVHEKGIEIISVQDPVNPQTVNTITAFDNAWDVFIKGDLLYVADGTSGIQIYSVADPLAPYFISQISTSGYAREVIATDDYLYVALGSQGFDIIDISDPYQPFLISNFNTKFGITNHINYFDDIIFSATWELLNAVDVSDPFNPVLLATEHAPFRAMGVGVNQKGVFLADWNRVRIYEFEDYTLPDIHVKPGVYDFGFQGIGVPISKTFEVFNLGETNLDISVIGHSNTDFSSTPASLDILPGENEEVIVTFIPQATTISSNRMRFISNDPDEATYEVMTFGGNFKLSPGDTATDFTLNNLQGEPVSLSDYYGKIIVMAFFASW